MMQTETQIDEQKIKKYLFGEMSAEERDAMEEEFFDNDELFYEIADVENRLVDLYARKKLVGNELVRFEKSLELMPERRAKVANAAALQTFIDEERPQEEVSPVVAAPTFWQKIGDLFRVPAFGYSMAAMLLIFAFATVFLVLDNRRKAGEIANLQNVNQGGLEQKQKELQERFDVIDAQYKNLQQQQQTQTDAGDFISRDLERISEEKERVEKELEQIKKEKNIIPTPTQKPQTQTQQIFAFLLTPIATRGAGGTVSRNLSITPDAKQVSMRLAITDKFEKEDRLNVKLNGKSLANNLPVQKILRISIAATDFIEGNNEITVSNANGEEIKYSFNMRKK